METQSREIKNPENKEPQCLKDFYLINNWGLITKKRKQNRNSKNAEETQNQ